MTIKEKLAAAQKAGEAGNQAYDALFAGGQNHIANSKQIVMLPVNKLHPFAVHTFQLHEGAPDYIALVESIRRNGIQEPVIVRQHPKLAGEYEIIVGHRRHHIASVECGMSEIPCVVLALDDALATQLMGESNINRPDWLPSEKAKTYAVHLEATRAGSGIHAGRPHDNSGHSAPNLSAPQRNRDEAAKIWGIDGKTFARYLKLNDLIPQLLELVDAGRITVVAGYNIAFLPQEQQELIAKTLDMYPQKKIDNAKGITIRNASQDNALTEQYLLRIFEVLPTNPDRKPIRIALTSSTLTKSSTIKRALDDVTVMEQIERILIEYANSHDLPLS